MVEHKGKEKPPRFAGVVFNDFGNIRKDYFTNCPSMV